MIKIYADRALVEPGERHVVMLYPFWGKLAEDPANPATGRYDKYVEAGRSVFELSALGDADVAVLPTPWEDIYRNPHSRSLAGSFLERAAAAGKRPVIFFWSDSDDDVPVQDALILRTSFYRSTRRQSEFALPAWSEDIVEKYLDGVVPLRPKQEKPVVGFCGWAGPVATSGQAGPFHTSLTRRLRHAANRVAHTLHIRTQDTTRADALQALSRSARVKANFVVRDRYLGGPTILKETQDANVVQAVRREFVQNLEESDYVLCVRGTGNYSYRLYETLSCGRIPIFINTDSVLPYDFCVDWKQFCVWVEKEDVSHIAEIVADFHSRLSPAEFVALQRECRRFWEEWLSPLGFFANFHRHLEQLR